MGDLLNILLLLFCNEFNDKLYNTEAQDYSIYRMMLIFFFKLPFLREKIIPYMCDFADDSIT